MEKYLVVPGNTDLNRGDQALIWETVRLLKEIDNNAEIRIILSGDDIENRELQSKQTREKGYLFTPSLMAHPGRGTKRSKKSQFYSKTQYISWGIRAIRDIIPRVLLLSRFKKMNNFALKRLPDDFIESYNFLVNSSAVIFKGGGFIHSYGAVSDPYHMFYYLYYAMLAKKHDIKVVFMPNSFGPFKNKIAKFYLKKVLKDVDIITVRELVSKTTLKKELDIKSEFYPDLGFFMNEDSEFDVIKYFEKYNIPENKKKVGITVRPYRFDGEENPQLLYQNYIHTFQEFVKYLKNNNYEPILIAQTMGPSFNEDDNEAIQAILKDTSLNEVTVISDFELDASMIKKIYRNMDYVIGTRFHSVIFSISSNVPSIAISYGGNKGKGIMEELGLSDYEISINIVTPESLKELFVKMVEDTENYKLIIQDKMLKYNSLRRNLVDLLSNELKRK